METFSALLAICAGNSLVTGEFPAQSPVMRSFDVFFDLHLNKRLNKQSWGWRFETPSRPLWRHCNGETVVSLSPSTCWLTTGMMLSPQTRCQYPKPHEIGGRDIAIILVNNAAGEDFYRKINCDDESARESPPVSGSVCINVYEFITYVLKIFEFSF